MGELELGPVLHEQHGPHVGELELELEHGLHELHEGELELELEHESHEPHGSHDVALEL